MSDVASRWRVPPGSVVALGDVDTRSTAGAPGGKSDTKDASKGLKKHLAELQERLWAEKQQSLLVVLQAMDAGGKDSTIKHCLRGVNPQGVSVTAFGPPSEEELAHDFLWRVHRVAPRAGSIGVFNRSHYEDVVAARVRGLVDEAVWRPRYRRIRHFELGLHEAGTTIVKLFLHISPDEQAERFQKRLDRPDKRWKFRRSDLGDRALWDDFQAAYADAISETSTDNAPWFVVPADRKWYRDWAVLTILTETLDRMDPQFPEPEEGLDEVVVR